MSQKQGYCPPGKLATTKGLFNRKRRYACDPEMEPYPLLTDEELKPLAAMLDATLRVAKRAFDLCQRPT